MDYTEMVQNVKVYGLENAVRCAKFPMAVDAKACNEKIIPVTGRLAKVPTGTGHDVFLDGIIVQFDLTMSVKMSVELERYHFIDFISSQSTMHRITSFDLDKQYMKYVDPRMVNIMKEKVSRYNTMSEFIEGLDKDNPLLKRRKKMLREMYLGILYSNPCGFRLTAGMTTNYRQLKTIYQQRKNHRLPEWRAFCKWIETLPNSEWITGETKED